MARKLKVYRTPIGFHDAYVAAPTQKAALEAWGTETNLFARGFAEIVEDPELSAEPLAHPGKVVKLARGTAAEHLNALPQEPKRKARTLKASEPPDAKSRARAQPEPSRKRMEAVEQALTDMEIRHQRDERDQEAKERELASLRLRMTAEHEKERARLASAERDERVVYERALRLWEPEA
jgi:hypothetical protein